MEKSTIKYGVIPIAIISLLLIAIKFDSILSFLQHTDLLKLIILIVAATFGLMFAGPGQKILTAWLFDRAGKRKPLSEKKCRELVVKYVESNVLSHGVAGHDLNIVAQRLDGTDFDVPFGWFAVTTKKFPGTRKLRMDEVNHNELFVCYVNRLNGDISYQPTIDNEEQADNLLKDLRMHGLPFDKVRKSTELEKLLENQKAVGYATETGKGLAQSGKPINEPESVKK